jgi:4-amino-4-deoxy-L-arabinose transferase-like glycosyltransferase
MLPLGLVLLAFALRLYHLTFQSLWRDEVDSLRFATRALSELLATFRKPGENGPLFFLELRPWLAAAGHSEFALRFPSALAGTLAVPIIFVLVRRLAGKWPAAIAALLAATAPYLVWYGQEAKMYAALTALVPLALWLTLEAARRGGWWRWLLLYVVTSLCFYTHLLAALVVPLQAIWFLLLLFRPEAHAGRGATADENVTAPLGPVSDRARPGMERGGSVSPSWPTGQGDRPQQGAIFRTVHRGRWLAPVLYLTTLILPYLPLAWWQLKLWLSPTFQTGHPFVPLSDILTVLAVAFSRGVLPVQRWYAIFLSVPAFLAMMAGIGLWTAGEKETDHRHHLGRWRAVALLLTWLLLPPLAVYGISLGMPIFTDRYLIWVMPAFLALVGMGIVALGHIWRPLGLVVAILILTLSLADVAAQANRPIKADFRATAHFVAAHQRPEDLLIFQIPYNRFTYEYYSGPIRQWLNGPYTNDGMSEDAVAAELARGTAGASAVWLIASEMPLWDARGLTGQWLTAHGSVTDRGEFTRVTATRYALQTSNE